jgi:flagellar basal body-associated protein FliL
MEAEPEYRDEDERLRARRVQSVLLLIGGILLLVIAAGTIYGLATGSRARKLARQGQDSARPGYGVFSDIGTIRAPTADKKAAVVVATLSFPYPNSDTAFKEELHKKAPALKEAAINCLARHTAAQLNPAYEGSIKAELRDVFNGLLSLGRVDEVWLSDFSVVQ